jgi:LmbE family N-acetylglucosaminyl deacetylase/CheY-like chemotaxis protein
MTKNDVASVESARVLIVDPDEGNSNLACEIFKKGGYQVDAVENASQAISKTQQNTYKLMLIDVDLPDLPASKLLNRIYDTIPKIRKIITADTTKQQAAASVVKQGADAYLLKPCTPETLLATAEEQLKKQKIIPPCQPKGECANILFIGAHPDDIELGCGGTLVKHIQNGDNVYAMIFTNGEKGMRDTEPEIDRQNETLQALTIAGLSPQNIFFLQYPDTELWQIRQEVMNTIAKFCEAFQIQLIYTHSNKAQHQDHVTIYEETMRGARKVFGIMAYESHGATNPSFSPNLFVDITDVIDKKIAMLNCHQSQISKSYFKVESVIALAQFRSSQSEEFHYAEAFEIIKMNLYSHHNRNLQIRDIFRLALKNSITETKPDPLELQNRRDP